MTDLAEDGLWVDDNTGEPVVYTDWKKGEPNGGTTQNCGNVVPPGGWTDRPCHVDKARNIHFYKFIKPMSMYNLQTEF